MSYLCFMIKQSEQDKYDYLGRTVFIFLFFLFVCFFTNSSDRPADRVNQIESAFISNSNAIAINDFQQFLSLKSLQPVAINHFNSKILNENLDMIAVNTLINQKIIILQEARLKIKPVVLSRYYRPCHFTDTGDIPVLS